MNLPQKIGQLLIFGIPDVHLTSEVIENLQKWHLGGVILFSRNLQNVTQSKNLISKLNELLSTPDYPLWLCVDQEGGVVVRMTEGVSVFPGNMALGATQDSTLAYEMGRITAEEWGDLGVNVNLAPVLDFSYAQNPGIGVRSLGEEKQAVTELGIQLIQGMQDHGMSATAKHFPGKGLARKDSHLDLPKIDISKAELNEKELYPFIKAIEAKVDFMMSSHCIYSAIDPKVSATLSKPILTHLLKDELGFKGLVISDDLEMGAIDKSLPIEEAALKFLQAGGDQVLVCHTPEAQEKVFQRLIHAVETNELSEALLDEKLEKIQAIKQKWLRWKKNHATRLTRNDPLPLEIARRSITVVRNEEKQIPLKGKEASVLALCVDYSPLTLVEENSSNNADLRQLLEAHCDSLEFVTVSLEPQEKEVNAILNRANKTDLLLIFTYNAHMYLEQAELVRSLLQKGKKHVVCALRNPYDLNVFPEAKNFILSYGFREASLKALVEVLFGIIPAKGKCPVSFYYDE